ncbi:glycosyltransferase [Solirubrobacter sp. CPCC 204708]|uniref:Glycosyltransferase n=1 Tax=Solirubrobacter deserti TaxID=2282478 RepID=A0ABT4RJJ0_9ACTN|nr:glycosyltransferase [Solirubrobacter deserti]MBE2320810.1 glycosyltransferase [Solirubrobacter deserti]MDA0138445.1 glycosyltransferase [Solirubrobacter deserti]
MDVVRVLAKLEPGGAQLSALRLSVALREHGIETRLLAGEACRAGLQLAREHGFEPECLRGELGRLQWAPSRAFAAWLAPRLAGAELVHAHMFGAWWAAAQVLAPEVPLVASEHNALTWPGPPQERELRAALPRVDHFFAHGPAARATVLKAGLAPERLAPGRSPVVGLAASPRPGLPSPRIVFCGRLAPDKGPDVLARALRRVPACPPAYFVGDGPLREHLEALAPDAVFAGWQRDPAPWVAGAAVLAAPSRADAWSQSVVTAMALGTPVVAAAVEGLPAVLADGRGILVAPEDPDALAAALDDVLCGRRRPDLAAAREYALGFTPELVAEQYAAVYARVSAELRSFA